jgi:hypothetical protein
MGPVSYVPAGAVETDSEKLSLILQNQEREARRRRLTLLLGGLGALIAAARLGIVAIPLVKEARARQR